MTKKGFTLIEMMVVVLIIGILATIVVVNVNDSRLRTRDAKRMADIKAIRDAVELYAEDHDGLYWYITGMGDVCWNPADNADFVTAVKPYLSSVPTDPKSDGTYFYQYCVKADGSEYKVYASGMESAEGKAKAGADGGTNVPNSSTWYELFSSGGSAL